MAKKSKLKKANKANNSEPSGIKKKGGVGRKRSRVELQLDETADDSNSKKQKTEEEEKNVEEELERDEVADEGEEEEEKEEEMDSDVDLLEIETEGGQHMDFNFEAFPVEGRDKDGILNMLTQIFLRPDLNLEAMADAIIAESPIGTVIGPADDEADEEDETNAVFGLVTLLPVQLSNASAQSAHVKIIHDYLNAKIAKLDNKQQVKQIEEKLKSPSLTMFINERMLQFPNQIIPPTFKCLRDELQKSKKKYDTIVYIQKIRKASSGSEDGSEASSSKKSKAKNKKKKNTVATAHVLFDNPEDEFLTTLSSGTLDYVDMAVHMDVAASSKFHSTTRNGTKYLAYRRIAIMDRKRFDAFVDNTSTLRF